MIINGSGGQFQSFFLFPAVWEVIHRCAVRPRAGFSLCTTSIHNCAKILALKVRRIGCFDFSWVAILHPRRNKELQNNGIS